MSSVFDLVLTGSLVAVGCAGSVRLSNTDARISPDVHVLTSNDMYAWCNMVDIEGHPVDPEGMCEDFRTPPLEVIASFEARLPRLLAARGRGEVARSLDRYVRQYWAVFRDGKLHIVGNFVCRSTLMEAHLADVGDDLKPVPENQLARVPIVVDDAGACNVTASFPADRPEDVQF